MQLPFERQHAFKMTKHHLLFEKPQWEARPKSRAVRLMGSYVVGAVRAPHDYLHDVIKPVSVPSLPVLKLLEDVGRTYQLWANDNERIDQILEELIGFANFTTSPQQCHETIEVATSIEAQMAILGIMKGVNYRHA